VRIYVGSLPYQTTDQDLVDLFGQVGEVVSATVIMDRGTGRSKGFGFVEMSNDQDAQKAIEQLNGSLLGNRNIVVNEARERQESFGNNRSGGYQNRGGNGGGRRSDRSGGYRDRGY
jgi:RNA recognition motif-containing protein